MGEKWGTNVPPGPPAHDGSVLVESDPGPEAWTGDAPHPGQRDTDQDWPEIPGMPEEDDK